MFIQMRSIFHQKHQLATAVSESIDVSTLNNIVQSVEYNESIIIYHPVKIWNICLLYKASHKRASASTFSTLAQTLASFEAGNENR